MTVASTVSRNVYNVVVGQTVFPFTFPIINKGDLVVSFQPTDGAITTLVLNVDYSVFGEGQDAGGNVTLLTPAAVAGQLVIQRFVQYTQPTDYKNQGSFYPSTIERSFDRATMQVQQISETIGRTVTFPITTPISFSAQLPGPPVPGSLFGVNADGTASRYYTPADIATTVAFANFRYDRFVANPGQTAFTLAADPGALGNLDVSIDGVTQVPVDDYTLSGTTMTLTGAMTGGEVVLARYGTAAGATDASVMVWQPAGSGAVQRTAQDKFREVVSVKDFGATGDNITNDRAAVQAAIDYAASLTNGAEVFFPAGTYRFNVGINVPNSKSITLRGEGDASKLRLFSGAGGPILNCGSGTIFSTRTIIKSLFFQGPDGGTSSGIRLQNCNTARIEDCVFQNQVYGIESVSSFAIEVTGNVFDVCSLYGFIATTACHNAVIERNNFFTCQAQGVRFDVLSDNLVIDNNNFEYCGSNVRLNNCNSVSIRNNYMEYQSNAFFEFLGTCRQVFIESNWCALGTGGGAILSLANINGGAFRANTIFDQTVSIGTGLVDFEIGANYKTGTGTMPVQNWTAPALLNSWANQANYNPAGYRKDENNVVHLRGNLITGTVGSVAFNLPAGYRPANFGTYASAGTSGLAACEIRPNGDVFISVAPSNQAGLNGISFKAEA